MKRTIIKIDEDLCNGCGECIPNCPEGALQIIDGKARLVSDLFCDGLGACIGHCPLGALTFEEREAEPYDERAVMANMVRQGMSVIKAHLEHLAEHGEKELLKEAIAYLIENDIEVPDFERPSHAHAGCPSAQARSIEKAQVPAAVGDVPSMLEQWPVQLSLVHPQAPYFVGADLLIAADCTAFALGAFHSKLLTGRKLVIACPKLDSNQDEYVEKLAQIFSLANIASITVAIMEVPCCRGLVFLVQEALRRSASDIAIRQVVIGINGDVISDVEI
ncbi:4Fe-4S binding protein [Spirochaetia bacterium 38H-sp]|uniref:4Fe-4S binding protein n=1 Tax=Rarispira pelagica TaxID=3141764 RepID=A0ABU9U8L5_9SPIR